MNDYGPFVKYMLGIVVAAYRDFSDRVQTLVTSGLSKSECVAKLIEDLTEFWELEHHKSMN